MPSLENGKTVKVNLLDEDEIGFGSTIYQRGASKKVLVWKFCLLSNAWPKG